MKSSNLLEPLATDPTLPKVKATTVHVRHKTARERESSSEEDATDDDEVTDGRTMPGASLTQP